MKELDDYIAFDLEFNTVDKVAHLIQVSAVKFQNRQEVETFDSLVYSDVPVSAFVTGLTGITTDAVRHAKPADQVIADFKAFVGDMPLIGYNAVKSDLPILKENGADFYDQYGVDVYNEADAMRSNKLHGIKNFQLSTVAEFFGIKGHAHNALDDARMTGLLYEAMRDMLDAEANYKQDDTGLDNNPFGSLVGLF
jgi:DNA polymerase-3 subunit epsilon